MAAVSLDAAHTGFNPNRSTVQRRRRTVKQIWARFLRGDNPDGNGALGPRLFATSAKRGLVALRRTSGRSPGRRRWRPPRPCPRRRGSTRSRTRRARCSWAPWPVKRPGGGVRVQRGGPAAVDQVRPRRCRRLAAGGQGFDPQPDRRASSSSAPRVVYGLSTHDRSVDCSATLGSPVNGSPAAVNGFDRNRTHPVGSWSARPRARCTRSGLGLRRDLDDRCRQRWHLRRAGRRRPQADGSPEVVAGFSDGSIYAVGGERTAPAAVVVRPRLADRPRTGDQPDRAEASDDRVRRKHRRHYAIGESTNVRRRSGLHISESPAQRRRGQRSAVRRLRRRQRQCWPPAMA